MSVLYDIADYIKNLYHRVKMRILAKDVQRYYLYIHNFLFEILDYISHNTNLDLQDFSTLAYNDYQIRHDCVFYIFSFIAQTEPDDLDSLQKTLNEYIRRFIKTYGIVGMQSTYLGVPSIYIDTLAYKEKIMYFKVLYVNSHKSHNYISERKTDSQSEATERMVHDDEL